MAVSNEALCVTVIIESGQIKPFIISLLIAASKCVQSSMNKISELVILLIEIYNTE